MSPELIGILSVGVAIAAAIIVAIQRFDKRIETLEARVDSRIDTLETRMNDRIDTLEARIDNRIDTLEARINDRMGTLEARMDKRSDALEARMAALEKGQARLEGLIDVLREGLFAQATR